MLGWWRKVYALMLKGIVPRDLLKYIRFWLRFREVISILSSKNLSPWCTIRHTQRNPIKNRKNFDLRKNQMSKSQVTMYVF